MKNYTTFIVIILFWISSASYAGTGFGVSEVGMLTSLITGVENNEVLPKKYQLNQNYPNPFNPTTQISFDLPQKSKVKLSVYNLLGEKIAVLIDEFKNVGTHTVSWDASDLASGVYMYRLEADGFVQTRKMILLQ